MNQESGIPKIIQTNSSIKKHISTNKRRFHELDKELNNQYESLSQSKIKRSKLENDLLSSKSSNFEDNIGGIDTNLSIFTNVRKEHQKEPLRDGNNNQNKNDFFDKTNHNYTEKKLASNNNKSIKNTSLKESSLKIENPIVFNLVCQEMDIKDIKASEKDNDSDIKNDKSCLIKESEFKIEKPLEYNFICENIIENEIDNTENAINTNFDSSFESEYTKDNDISHKNKSKPKTIKRNINRKVKSIKEETFYKMFLEARKLIKKNRVKEKGNYFSFQYEGDNRIEVQHRERINGKFNCICKNFTISYNKERDQLCIIKDFTEFLIRIMEHFKEYRNFNLLPKDIFLKNNEN